jgi:hypothetical protein
MYEWAVFCMNGQFPIGSISPWRYFASIGFFIACLLCISDDDNALPIWLNFIAWQAQVFLSLGFFITTHMLMKGVLIRQNNFIKLALSSLIAVTLLSPVSLLRDVYIEQETAYTLTALFEEWQNMVPPALLSWVAINVPWLTGLELKRTKSSNTPGPEIKQPIDKITNKNYIEENTPLAQALQHATKETENSFLALAKVDDVNSIIYLKAELHYLKVVSEHSSHLILYNLKDAITALTLIDPLLSEGQTHRSYWVNHTHADKLLRKNREGEVLLSNQDKIPVSRANIKKVKAWFE